MTPDTINQIGHLSTLFPVTPSQNASPLQSGLNSSSAADIPFIELVDVYFFLPIAIVGIPCNLVVIAFIAFVPSLRTTINQLKLNLAAADVIYLSINPLLNALVTVELNWWQCQIVSYLQYIAQQTTCCLLLVMTIIRYDATIHPLTSEARWTTERRMIAIAVAWTASIFLMIPSVLFTECDEDIAIGHLVTYSYVTLVIFVVPMFIHAFCHLRILLDFSDSQRRERKRSEGSIHGSPRCRLIREKRSLTRQVVIIVLVFFVCRAPLEAFLLWKVSAMYQYGPDGPTEERTAVIVHLTCKALAYFTGIINPFLYAFCSPSFRTVFREWMPETWRKGSTTSSTTKHILPNRWRNGGESRAGSYSSDRDRPLYCVGRDTGSCIGSSRSSLQELQEVH